MTLALLYIGQPLFKYQDDARSNTHKIVKWFLDQPDADCHKSKHVAVMLYFKC